MNRVDRLFSILTVLQSKKHVTAEQLSMQFGISIRTVYRDIRALDESGIPVGFEPGKGYFVVQGYFLAPIALTSEEAQALLVSEALVEGFADKGVRQHFGTALAKVKSVLKTSQKERIHQLSASMKMQIPQRVSPDFDYIPAIQEAITSRIQLELSYTNAKEITTIRRIEPIGLVFYAFSWHVIGWCHLRDEYRDFKISRITQLRLTELPFEISEHIALGTYQLPVNY